MTVFVRSKKGPHGLPVPVVRTRAKRMLDAIDRASAELSIMLVDDATIHELNRTYRSVDRPTDVLSFAMSEGEFGAMDPDMLGDVIISVPTASRQAKRARRSPLDEVTFLLAHGLLHLVGYDHQTDDQERVMKRETRRLMAAAMIASTRPARASAVSPKRSTR